MTEPTPLPKREGPWRFTLNRKAFKQMVRDQNAGALPDEELSEEDLGPWKWNEIYYAETEDEKAYFIHLNGAMRHPGEICDCPPEEPYRKEADELIDVVFNAGMNSERRTLLVARFLREFLSKANDDSDDDSDD